jgi:hypothetical protein
VALAVAPSEIKADATIAMMPLMNIGNASFSKVLRLLILSPIGLDS